mmetsp:Transcript_3690/g.5514  ORF Transcript_3690/g.5514 Transcript_3690/m.5514 type:complete len:221 (+) Transcript_3690:220-882(+)
MNILYMHVHAFSTSSLCYASWTMQRLQAQTFSGRIHDQNQIGRREERSEKWTGDEWLQQSAELSVGAAGRLISFSTSLHTGSEGDPCRRRSHLRTHPSSISHTPFSTGVSHLCDSVSASRHPCCRGHSPSAPVRGVLCLRGVHAWPLWRPSSEPSCLFARHQALVRETYRCCRIFPAWVRQGAHPCAASLPRFVHSRQCHEQLLQPGLQKPCKILPGSPY